ncbi:MAG TPA: CBS domain-containing protein [Deinococcales bacterium]|nr:CBS domain-containing protein [Deinococcales bacterium]
MLVKDWMTPAPLTITPETPVLEALRLLKERGFRRLPVVESGGGSPRLAGIVTDKDLKDAMPSKATTLSVWELNYLLSKLTVREVMARPVITARLDETLEDAALRMQDHKIGGLPVLDDAGALVGIITITDTLRAIIQVFGLNEGGVRVTMDMPDVPGSLEAAAHAVRPSNIVSVATGAHKEGRRRFVMRLNGEGVEGVVERLRAAGIDVESSHGTTQV